MQATKGRIPELDGLRAFAVAAVVLYHLVVFSGNFPKFDNWVLELVKCIGKSGVSVFFIISGYIITNLLLRERELPGGVSLKAFYVRRFFRIVPPFAVYLIVVFILGASGLIIIGNRNILISALFLGDFNLFGATPWFVGHTWSLSVEEQFYLLFPPMLCLVFEFQIRRCCFVLLVGYGVSLLSLKAAHDLSLHLGSGWMFLTGLWHFRYIIVGVLIALTGKKVLKALVGTPRSVPLFLFLGMLWLQLCQAPIKVLTFFQPALEPIFCGLFVMWFMQNPDKCRLLRWGWIQWAGACSYSIYLWQQLFTGEPQLYHGWRLAHSSLAVVAILICAALSYYWVEKPSIKLGRHISNRFRSTELDGKSVSVA